MTVLDNREFMIVADAGSTKVDWALICMEGGEQARVSTAGINGVSSSDSYILHILEEVKMKLAEKIKEFSPSSLTSIYFYGAGCATLPICEHIAVLLKKGLNDNAAADVESDLVGAARALFGKDSGIACILGTGSNTCLYKDGEIAANIAPLGYVLGDEGSGTALGKTLIREIFRNEAPRETIEAFKEYFRMDLKDVLQRVYKETAPNVFLASMVPFLKEHESSPYVKDLVKREFKQFFSRTVKRYDCSRNYPLGFIGSIAENFKSVLFEVAEEEGYRIDKILHRPIEGIINYHVNHII